MYSVFVENGCLQYRGCGWRGSHSLGYHNYLITSRFDRKEAEVLAYGASFIVVKKSAAGSAGKRVEQVVVRTSGTVKRDKSAKKECKD